MTLPDTVPNLAQTDAAKHNQLDHEQQRMDQQNAQINQIKAQQAAAAQQIQQQQQEQMRQQIQQLQQQQAATLQQQQLQQQKGLPQQKNTLQQQQQAPAGMACTPCGGPQDFKMLKGKRCGEWGDLCDHISADAHAAALQEHCFAENLYNAAIASWGEHWTQDQWDQDFACNTTGPEGTRKSLLTQEEQEIIDMDNGDYKDNEEDVIEHKSAVMSQRVTHRRSTKTPGPTTSKTTTVKGDINLLL